MFHQPLSPVAGDPLLSFLVATLPIAAVLILLGIVRRPAWQASLAGLVVALALATMVWRMPVGLALTSVAAGMSFALWPVMWIVFNALALYNLTVRTGRFEAMRRWVVQHLPNDSRVVLVIVGFCFGCLLEGVAGFGTPIAITSALLIALGFPAIDALVVTLTFNTAPVAFGALGAPVTTLAAVSQIPASTLGAMIGRQLPLIALFLPFYVIGVNSGVRSLRGVWPMLLVTGGSFAAAQFVCANYIGYELTDVFSSMISLIAGVGFLQIWKPRQDPAFALRPAGAKATNVERAGWAGWLPWAVLTAVVILWIHLGVNLMGEHKIAWPGLHRRVFITAYGRPYDAIWGFQPLASGTAILVSTLVTAALVRAPGRQVVEAFVAAAMQVRLPAVTTALIVGLAYLMNYAGITYTLGLGVASAGIFFPILSAFLGWLAVFLSGSDTSGNALFGNLQVVAANHLGLSPVLMAATNSSGGVLGKMVSPQNISTGVAVTNLRGQEGAVLARTFKHSIILTLILGGLVVVQQYLLPGTIPAIPHPLP